MIARLKNEPVALAALAPVAMLISTKLGVSVTVDDLSNALLAVVAVCAWWARSRVSPVKS